MKPLSLLLALMAPALAAPSPTPTAPAASTTPAATTPPVTTPVPAAAPAVNDVVAPNGLHVLVDLHDEYVTGFSQLVHVTVRNDTDKPLTFPDLAARPHLVRFNLRKGTVRWERYTTPPAVDPPTTWTILPRGQRQVLLEIPSSAGLDPGDWELGVEIQDPAGTVTFPMRTVKLAPAKVVGGAYNWESTIQQTIGGMIPWVHKAATGFDLYVLRMDPKSPSRPLTQVHLTHLPTAVEPILTRSRAPDALSRYLYWQTAGNTFAVAQLQTDALAAKPRMVSVPYPKVEPLGRGATDGDGGVIIPLWVPAPKGTAGVVQALCVDKRGLQTLREVARLPARPATVATAVDAASNLLLALGHAAAVDLYRVDPTLPAEIGARGSRVTPLTDGWSVGALAFDSLPDRGDRPGGLALLSVLVHPGQPQGMYKSIWSDLGGKSLEETSMLPWTAPGPIISLLPAAYGPFHYLTQDSAGKVWYGVQGGAAKRVDGAAPGVLWTTADTVSVRRLVDGTVFEDRALGPVGQ